VIGGSGETSQLSSAEIFPPPTSDACTIPDLPEPRWGHTLSLLSGGRLVVCGGAAGIEGGGRIDYDSCLTWSEGSTSWTPLFTMRFKRYWHMAWTPPSSPDSIVVMGGMRTNQTHPNQPGPSINEAEVLPGGATFELRHGGAFGCAIPDGETIVQTGGWFKLEGELTRTQARMHGFVTRYDVNGFVEELTPLPEPGRRSHACAALPDTGAFIVAGGDSTSALMLLPGATAWLPIEDLPRKFNSEASIVGGRLRLPGGKTGHSPDDIIARSEVLEYEPNKGWVEIGRLQVGRIAHAVLTIGTQELSCL